jgi:hypothetical protein
MTQGSPQDQNRIYSLISTIFLVLTALTLCGVIGYAVAGPKQPGVASEPTLFVFPSDTPTLIGPTAPATGTKGPTSTLAATFTPSQTPRPSSTATPTDTATATSTLTPSNTPLPTATFTATLAPTRALFNYVLQDGGVTYKKNSKFPGCDAVIAGVVKDITGNQGTQVGMKVHVTGNGADTIVTAGDHGEYGTSGWEYYYNNTTSERTYIIQLQYGDGVAASDNWQVTTNSNCNKNLTFATFVQIQNRQ